MDIAAHLARLEADGPRLAAQAQVAGLTAPVPTCPGWSVRDLLAHTAGVYRWAIESVRDGARGFTPLPEGPADDAELAAWFAASHAELVDLLRTTPAGHQCWTFWPVASPVAFWARRQAHETAMHLVDVVAAAGPAGEPPQFPAEFAADGIDELLAGLLAHRPKGPRTDAPVQVAIVPDDAPAWRVGITAERIAVEPVAAEQLTAAADGAAAALTVRGPAAEVYTWLWNRGGEVALSGDASAAELWRWLRVRR